MGKTSIEWTEETWNPVTGCTKVSEGCRHCYAETMHNRFAEHLASSKPAVAATTVIADDHNGSGPRVRARRFNEVFCHEDRLEQPLHWRKPRRVFVNSMSDLFHEAVPNAFIDRVFAVMALCPQHVFQVLTKRPERMRRYLSCRLGQIADVVMSMRKDNRPVGPLPHLDGGEQWWPLANVWAGASAEDQKTLGERWYHLRLTPAAVRFLSLEPLIEEVDFQPMYEYLDSETLLLPDWVIVGGESGPKARPCDVAWIRSVVDHCDDAGVPCFVKQLGSRPVFDAAVDDTSRLPKRSKGRNRGDRIAFRSHKGNDPAEWPEDLRVREYPER
jgi:protein gp37